MNLFILSLNHKECAKYMFDKHISKMILEAVQMLCTTIHVIDELNEIIFDVKLYKICHKNHPVTKWMRESLANYMWTIKMVEAMHEEWKFRYNHPKEKKHQSYILAEYLKKYAPDEDKFPKKGLTPFAQAMPEEYKSDDPVESYRKYYQSPDKQLIAKWKKRDTPEWYSVV